VYDAASAKEVATLPTDIFVNSLTFALGDTRVAGAYGDGRLRIWDVATGTILHDQPAGSNILFFVAAAPDGRTLATVGQDARIRLWDAATGARLRVIE
jgi:WD40 repeat protein